jgi:hypothetical protein
MVTAINLGLLDLELTQRRRTAVLVGLVVIICIIGHNKKFLYEIVRSQKPL